MQTPPKTHRQKETAQTSFRASRSEVVAVPKPDLVQIERVLDDAGRRHSHAQYVLLCRQIVRCGHPVYFHQVAASHITLHLRRLTIRI